MSAWTVGHNLAGYLPESDVAAFEDWSDAAAHYRWMVEDYADTADDAVYAAAESEEELEADPPAMRATVDSILSDPSFPIEDGKPYGMVIEDNDGRYISLWLDWSEDAEPDTDED